MAVEVLKASLPLNLLGVAKVGGNEGKKNLDRMFNNWLLEKTSNEGMYQMFLEGVVKSKVGHLMEHTYSSQIT